MLFHYRAVDTQGQIRQGQQESPCQTELEQHLLRQGLTLLRARPAQTIWRSKNRLGRRERITFCFHLEQLCRAGVPLLDGLADLRDSLPHSRFRGLLDKLITSIEGGNSFSESLALEAPAFDPVFIQLIRAGETSGNLPEAFHRLNETLKWQDELAAQMQKIILYPAFVATLILAVAVFMLLYLVPRLATFMQAMGLALPQGIRLMLALSETLKTSVWLLPGLPFAVMGLAALHGRASPAWRCRLDRWKLAIPLLGPILQRIILARFASNFAMLYASGIPVLDCLKVTEGLVGNRAVAAELAACHQRISEGSSISAGFAQTNLFPALVLRMLRVGEGSGQLDKALLNVAYFYDRDVKDAIDRMQRLIEPGLSLLLGLMLAWLVSSVLGPIFDLIGRIK